MMRSGLVDPPGSTVGQYGKRPPAKVPTLLTQLQICFVVVSPGSTRCTSRFSASYVCRIVLPRAVCWPTELPAGSYQVESWLEFCSTRVRRRCAASYVNVVCCMVPEVSGTEARVFRRRLPSASRLSCTTRANDGTDWIAPRTVVSAKALLTVLSTRTRPITS